MKKIKSLPVSLRPREKLLKYGAQVLSLNDLICVILVTGTKTASILSLSKKITKELKHDISKESLITLGIGESKTAQILAAIELGVRLNKVSNVVPSSPSHIFALSSDILSLNKETLLCFYMNARGEIIKRETVAVGSLNKALALPREIFSLIKELPVASIILVHNHPSGILAASEEDIKFTKRIKLAADILGIKLLDHLIITTEGFIKI